MLFEVAGELTLNRIHHQRQRDAVESNLRNVALVWAISCLMASGGLAADGTASFKLNTTADHSKFDQLKGPFESGPAVTKACLACHTEAAKQVHRTKHWTWEFLMLRAVVDAYFVDVEVKFNPDGSFSGKQK